jgi:regulatory protein
MSFKGVGRTVKKVTDLRRGKKRGNMINVFLDGSFAFSLQADTVAEEGLQVGQELSSTQVEALVRSRQYHHCLDAATRLLSYRPRSESELRERLLRRGFNGESIEATLAKLSEQGLVDDAAFARFWKEDRESFNPRSQWLTGLELRRKGVPEEIIKQTIGELDDGDNARRAAISKARRLPLSDYQLFRQRLGGFLKRRGFKYEVINSTVEQVWQELQNDTMRYTRRDSEATHRLHAKSALPHQDN